jgi:quercetin dioxygenase-like cupin family protein
VPPGIERVPRPEWEPLPYEGCRGVEGKVPVRDQDFFIAVLRFTEDGTIHEHPGPNDTIVVCLEGSGFTSLAGETAPLQAGDRVEWPRDVPHRLWTDGSPMTTMMVERTQSDQPAT